MSEMILFGLILLWVVVEVITMESEAKRERRYRGEEARRSRGH